jgi:hypothetical protein
MYALLVVWHPGEIHLSWFYELSDIVLNNAKLHIRNGEQDYSLLMGTVHLLQLII